jgi:hypothetical protein
MKRARLIRRLSIDGLRRPVRRPGKGRISWAMVGLAGVGPAGWPCGWLFAVGLGWGEPTVPNALNALWVRK